MKKSLYLFAILGLAFASCDMAPDKVKKNMSVDELFPVKLKVKDKNGADSLTIPRNSIRPGAAVDYNVAFEDGWVPEPGKYTYNWYMTREVMMGTVQRWDLVVDGDKPALTANVPATIGEGTFAVYFEIHNPANKTRKKWQCSALVAKDRVGGNGVYILKEVGGETDIDYFELSRFPTEAGKAAGYVFPNLLTQPEPDGVEPIIPYVKYENVMSDPDRLGRRLAGKPVGFVHLEHQAYYWWSDVLDENGKPKVENKSGAWFIQTENDMITTSNSFRQQYAGFDDLFFPTIVPGVKKPQGVFLRGSATGPGVLQSNGIVWFLNDNTLYGSQVVTPMAGQPMALTHAYYAPMPDSKPQNVKHVLIGGAGSQIWDEDRSQLYRVSTSGSLTDPSVGTYGWTTEGKELLKGKKVNMLRMMNGGGVVPGADSYMNAHFIMKNKTENVYYMVKWQGAGGATMFNRTNGDVWWRQIHPDADLATEELPAAMASSCNTDAIYYAKNGNELWLYQDKGIALGGEMPALEQYQVKTAAQIGAGETIVQISPLVADFNTAEKIRLIVVLTKTAGGYKYYVFENNGMTSEVKPDPIATFEGAGTPVKALTRVDVMRQLPY